MKAKRQWEKEFKSHFTFKTWNYDSLLAALAWLCSRLLLLPAKKKHHHMNDFE